MWYGYTGSVVWLPALIVALYLLGVHWDQSPRKILWLVASTLVCLALNYSLVQLARSPAKCGRALSNSWIGRSVNRAQAVVDEIEQFERDVA
jgi:4-amino-4-deoxy-L-arabinose transferase-like glycosyltransferase